MEPDRGMQTNTSLAPGYNVKLTLITEKTLETQMETYVEMMVISPPGYGGDTHCIGNRF